VIRALGDWLDDRTGCRSALRAWLAQSPPGGVGWSRVIGRCLVFLFVVEVLTGVPLMTVYTPSTAAAWGSVYHLEHSVFLGGWVRGVHHYASWLMMGLLPIYLLQIVFTRLYVPPRELAYWSALGCMGLILGLGLTGNALPWDQSGYWAIHVETVIVSTWPIVGAPLQTLALGGADLGQATITRLYTLHVFVLPLLLAFLFGLYRVSRRPSPGDGDPRWPHQSVRNLAAYAVLAAAAVGMTIALRTPLDAPADPSSAFPARPEWYVLFLYQLRMYFEGINELYATAVIPALATSVLLICPVFGWTRFRRAGHALVCLIALALVGGGVALTVLGVRADARDAGFQAERVEARKRADRAVELAAAGIPVEGAGVLLQRDPQTRGPILYGEHCVRCHRHTDVEGPGEEAANLTGYATVDWIERLILDPGHDNFFGQTEDMTRMADWSEENVEDMGAEGVRAVAEFLAAGSPAPSPPTATGPAEAAMQAGREVFMEYCFECHLLAAEEPNRKKRRRTKAVDLTDYATPEWTRRMLVEPDHKEMYGRKNEMPSYKDQLTETDMDVLIRWLNSED